MRKPPRTAEWILRRMRGSDESFSLLGDMEEEYSRIFALRGSVPARIWYWKQALASLFPFLRNSFSSGFAMLGGHLKIIFRNFGRHPGYSIITVSGLALGMACCLLILFYIRHELSYDRFHPGADRIHRIIMDATVGSTDIITPITNNPLAPTLAGDYPEVIAATRFRKNSQILAEYSGRQYYESGAILADGSFFEVFRFPFIQGDSRQALTRPATIVLTEKTAGKYFGAENPMGKTLRLDGDRNFEVTGVMEDIPSNSHLTFDMLISLETLLAERPRDRGDWISGHYYTYLLLAGNTDPRELESKLPALVEKYMGEQLAALEGSVRYSLQPVTDIHLKSHYQFEFAPNSSMVYIYIFATIAIVILAVACINFMNLATARSTTRAREVGMRKVLGAQRSRLIHQFLGESIISSLLALLISFVLILSARPFFKSIAGIDLRMGSGQLIWLVPLFIGLVLFTGIAAGSYPAFFLSAYHPVKVLKGKCISGSRNLRFRHILVVIQFAVSVILIIGTWVIRNQVKYMKTKELGFTKQQVLVSDVHSRDVFRNIDSVKARLKRIPGVVQVAGTDAVPGQGPMATTVGVIPEGFTSEQGILMKAIRADEDYLAALGMELVSGRDFSMEMSTDKQGAFLLNETAARRIGWDDPVGRTIRVQGLGRRGAAAPVIGVVRDFHYASLREEMEPICIGAGTGGLDKLVIRIRTDNVPGLITGLKEAWKGIDPAHPFHFFFLDDFFDAQYRAEERLNSLIAWFGGLAIVIACLGLFGLFSFTAEQRTREIGIRKVLGASISEVVILLSRELLVLVGAAVLIAWPVGYLIMSSWLRDFSFRTGLSPWIFLSSGLAALTIAFLTIGFQAIKAASADPVDSLRYE